MISLAKTISRRCHLIPGQTRHVQLHAGEQSIGFGGRAADKRAIIRADLSTIDTGLRGVMGAGGLGSRLRHRSL